MRLHKRRRKKMVHHITQYIPLREENVRTEQQCQTWTMKELRDTPKLAMVTPVLSHQQPKAYGQQYFDGMLNNAPLWVTPRSKRM